MGTKKTSGKESPDPNKVVIELDKSLSAQVYEDGIGLIHQSAMRDVRRFAREIAEKIQGFKDELENNERPPLGRSRVHETIFITGDRGSGKTTFLLNVLHKAGNRAFCEGNENSSRTYHFEPLRIIDPTHLTDKQHIFVNIIALIKEAVDRHFDENKIAEQREAKQREWKEMLHKLNRGLCNQDGIGSNKLQGIEWDDPQYILKEGLEDAQSGLLLEWRFHKLVNNSLEILGKDAFVLCFDDIDTSFDKGWPVLELLRKHLTTPQIIVLLSGEFALYSKLVRREQWKLFSGNSLFVKHCKRDHLEDEVERLEEQYLAKILPSRKRIDLKCAWELPDDLSLRIPGADPILLRHVMTAFTKVWFKYPTGICKRIGELFLHMPMRSLVSILNIVDDGCAKAEGHKKKEGNFAYKHAEIFVKEDNLDVHKLENLKKPNADQILSVHASLILANQDRLMALGFTQDDLRTILWTGQFSKLAQVLAQRDLMEHGASLLPSNVMQQDGLEILLLSGIYLSAMLADIKHVVDYYVRVLMVRDYYEFRHSKTTTNEERKKIEAEMKQLTSPQRSLYEISIDIALYMGRDALSDKVILESNWRDGQRWDNNGSPHDVKAIGNDKDCKEIRKWGRLLLNALSVCANGKYYISAYNFIALFGLCLGSGSSLGFDLKRFQRTELIDATPPDTRKMAQYYKDQIGHVDTGVQYESFIKFTRDVYKWAIKYHHLEPEKQELLLLPPYVHANIWSSFCARLKSKKRDDNVGPIGKLYIYFVSAIRDEEAIFRSMDNNNSSNLVLPYYNFVLKCPLWSMLATFECHLASSGNNSQNKRSNRPSDSPVGGANTSSTPGNSSKKDKKPLNSPSTPQSAAPEALKAKEPSPAASSQKAPAKRPTKAKPPKK